MTEEEELFINGSLLDAIHITQHKDIEVEVQKMIKRTIDSGLSEDETKELSDDVQDFKDVFRTILSPDHPDKDEQLKVELTTDAKPLRVRLRN